jgi:hypothetical protein
MFRRFVSEFEGTQSGGLQEGATTSISGEILNLRCYFLNALFFQIVRAAEYM